LSTGSFTARGAALGVAACVFAAVQVFGFLAPGVIDTWSERLADYFLMLKTAAAPADRPYDGAIVHVDLNNASLRALKDYHPTRSHHAQVVRNLGVMQVAVQMLDFVYAGPTGAENDRDLVRAVGAAGNVVIGMVLRLAPDGDEGPLEVEDPATRQYLEKTKWHITGAEPGARYPAGIDPLITLVEIAEISRGAGFLTLTPDRDGVVRRVPLIARLTEGFYPSFVLRAVCEYLQVSPERVRLSAGSIILEGALRPGAAGRRDLAIPVDERGCMRIHFAGPWGSLKHYNFSDIYQASDDPGQLELWEDELSGKIVLVSDISTGSADIGQVPIDEAFPLSGVHANAVNTILSGSFIREMPGAAGLIIELLLLAAVTGLSRHRSVLVFSLGSGGLGAAVFGAAGVFLVFGNFMFPAIRTLLVLGLAWAALLIRNAVDTARARAETEKARQLAERELEIGRKIQLGFLPGRIPVPAGWEIAAHFQPAIQVSGDFYDVFALGDGRFTGIVIADVCDHGVGSALFMALTRSLTRAFALQRARNQPAGGGDACAWSTALALETVRQANAYISETHGEAGMFATLFFGILDPQSGELIYVNGGHEPPVAFRRGGQPPVFLKATGLAVGALPDATYRAEALTLGHGDSLILYTDGITDAENEAGERFSRDRLVRLVSASAGGAQAMIADIVQDLNHHVGEGSPADDVTLMAISRMG
jgi:serine phosphatase RsbU (regulator of sigma subunit)/CHASE2 domain-containing sensor protein